MPRRPPGRLLAAVLGLGLLGCGPTPSPSESGGPSPAGTISPTSTATGEATAAASPPAAGLAIAGEPEAVFDWATQRCADDQLADLPARAIRADDGTISLYLSSTTNYRLTGPSFDALAPDCAPVLRSTFDPNPAAYAWAEWMGAPYTLDGRTVHALIHEEYHGDQAGSAWQASRDFAEEQGVAGWRYQQRLRGTYRAMRFDAGDDRWQGDAPLCQVYRQGAHPDRGCDAVRTWTSPVGGTVVISGRAYDQDDGGGDGVRVTISHGTRELWARTIQNGDAEGATFSLEVAVQAGDLIRFAVGARGDPGWDSTFLDAGIDLDGPPCPSNDHAFCTLIGLTYAVSTDGGATFTQPRNPDHFVAAPPHRYDPRWMRALWQPSNIVRHPVDGAFYVLVQVDDHADDRSRDVQGMCLLRTERLDDPAAWRAWDGAGFDLQIANPYVDPTVDPAADACTIVSPEVASLSYGLTWNEHLEAFVAIGVGFEGFYYSTSEDLITWRPRRFLMRAAQVFASGATPPYFPYPTLIDHDSTSPSFDVSGETPYLYYARFAGASANNGTDLLRVPVRVTR